VGWIGRDHLGGNGSPSGHSVCAISHDRPVRWIGTIAPGFLPTFMAMRGGEASRSDATPDVHEKAVLQPLALDPKGARVEPLSRRPV
jgi:hypothetical protein